MSFSLIACSDLKTLSRHGAQITETGGRAVLLGDDDIDQGAAERNAHAGDDVGKRTGKGDFAKNLIVFGSEGARHEDVAKLVGEHAQEQQQHEDEPVPRRRGAAGGRFMVQSNSKVWRLLVGVLDTRENDFDDTQGPYHTVEGLISTQFDWFRYHKPEFDLSTSAKAIAKDAPAEVALSGRYLYGAPASGLNLEGEMSIAAAAERPGFAGYKFGLFRLEGELGYKRTSIKSFSQDTAFGTAVTTALNPAGATQTTTFVYTTGTFSTFNLGSHVSVWSGMINGLLSLGDPNDVSFYAGPGIGLASVKSFGLSKSKFAYQGIAGVSFNVGGGVSLGLKYRYFHTGNLDLSDTTGVALAGNPNAVTVTTPNGPVVIDQTTSAVAFSDFHNHFSSHSLLASLIFNFKSVLSQVTPERFRQLGLDDRYWLPKPTDYYRFVLTNPHIDGILCSPSSPAQLTELVAQTGSTLQQLHGIGASGAARLLGDVADIARLATPAR